MIFDVQVAVARGTPIMSEKWITECWGCRDDTNASALQPPLSLHKQLPFTGSTIALHGFTMEEEEEMKAIIFSNGEEKECVLTGHSVFSSSKLSC